MAQQSFEEVLRLARELPPREQKQLAEALAHPPADDQPKEEFKSLGDALRARGLIGSMTDAPADLATNPKYMEGFGQHED